LRVGAKAIKVLEGTSIDGLVLLGGDGTFHGGTLLANECNVSILGVPTTIDNDVYGTDYTVGFDTAVNTAIEAIDRSAILLCRTSGYFLSK